MNSINKGLILFTSLLVPVTGYTASNTLYGDFRYSFNSIDNDVDSTLSGDNNASRIGLKGSTEEVDGISAFYHLQTGAAIAGTGSALTERFFLAGIKGDFGKVVVGRSSTPYKMAGLKVDPFYDTAAGKGLSGASYGLSGMTNGWSDNTFAYSKVVGDFSLNGGVYLDDTVADEHDMNFGLAYSQEDMTVGFQYLSIGDTGVVANSGADSSAIRFHGSYTTGPWVVSGSIESVDPSVGDKQSFIYLATAWEASEKLKIAGSYGAVDDVSVADNGSAITVGAFFQLLEKTNVYALFSAFSADDSAGADRSTLSLGVSHKISSKLM
ncbi:MAG: porin [Pseudomonadales bacterium]|nr:porin [Pseudomonadales bacterium]